MTTRRTNQILCQEKWKKLRFWKNEVQNRVGIFWQTPIFWAETFFQRLLENFPLTLRTCSRYRKGQLNLVLCGSKEIVSIRAPIRFYVKKVKKLRFWKNEAQIGLEYSDKTPFFWGETFFSKVSRKFCVDFTNTFKVLQRSTEPSSLRQ